MLTKMNLKYYLRGLGIGIIVTALIIGIVTGGRGKALSDEEIIKRAEQLGMTMESDVLSEALPETEGEEAPIQEEEEAPIQEEASAQTDLQDNAMEKEGQDPQAAEAAPQEEEIMQEADEQTDEQTEKQTEKQVPISILGGEGSMSVCRKLQEAGLVASASEFDTFLCQNGYDKKLKAGDFEIPEQADPEQIARILCRME